MNNFILSKQELLDRLDMLFERLGEYPWCEHIAKEIDRVQEAIEELEGEEVND